MTRGALSFAVPASAPAVTKPKAATTLKRISACNELAFQIKALKLPIPEAEFMFAKGIGRKWRFDLCWPAHMTAVEIEGLVVKRIAGQIIVSGRHATVQGFKDDTVKYASAVLLGWSILRFEQSLIRDGTAVDFIQKVLAAKGWRRGDSKLGR